MPYILPTNISFDTNSIVHSHTQDIYHLRYHEDTIRTTPNNYPTPNNHPHHPIHPPHHPRTLITTSTAADDLHQYLNTLSIADSHSSLHHAVSTSRSPHHHLPSYSFHASSRADFQINLHAPPHRRLNRSISSYCPHPLHHQHSTTTSTFAMPRAHVERQSSLSPSPMRRPAAQLNSIRNNTRGPGPTIVRSRPAERAVPAESSSTSRVLPGTTAQGLSGDYIPPPMTDPSLPSMSCDVLTDELVALFEEWATMFDVYCNLGDEGMRAVAGYLVRIRWTRDELTRINEHDYAEHADVFIRTVVEWCQKKIRLQQERATLYDRSPPFDPISLSPPRHATEQIAQDVDLAPTSPTVSSTGPSAQWRAALDRRVNRIRDPSRTAEKLPNLPSSVLGSPSQMGSDVEEASVSYSPVSGISDAGSSSPSLKPESDDEDEDPIPAAPRPERRYYNRYDAGPHAAPSSPLGSVTISSPDFGDRLLVLTPPQGSSPAAIDSETAAIHGENDVTEPFPQAAPSSPLGNVIESSPDLVDRWLDLPPHQGASPASIISSPAPVHGENDTPEPPSPATSSTVPLGSDYQSPESDHDFVEVPSSPTELSPYARGVRRYGRRLYHEMLANPLAYQGR
jgi:hypothetical protein